MLLNAHDKKQQKKIYKVAGKLKDEIYGNRVVMFAPLYISNYCVNNCKYCGFRTTNRKQVRTTLSEEELINEVEALEENGQKRHNVVNPVAYSFI